MTYKLESITIRTNNTTEELNKIKEIWQDVTTGKLPILFDNKNNFQVGISPISKYSNYENEEKGDYDLTILGVTVEFFKQMELKVANGQYKKYDISDESIEICTQKAWQQVWHEQDRGHIDRAFTLDYESSVPAEYTKDNKAHCYLYIAIK